MAHLARNRRDHDLWHTCRYIAIELGLCANVCFHRKHEGCRWPAVTDRSQGTGIHRCRRTLWVQWTWELGWCWYSCWSDITRQNWIHRRNPQASFLLLLNWTLSATVVLINYGIDMDFCAKSFRVAFSACMPMIYLTLMTCSPVLQAQRNVFSKVLCNLHLCCTASFRMSLLSRTVILWGLV